MSGEGQDYGEFDDWFGDGEACGAELQNQAASLETATKEERLARTAENINEPETRWGGKLVVKFRDGEKAKFKIRSGHIAQKNGDNYILLTTRSNLTYNQDGEIIQAESGMFVLQNQLGDDGKPTAKGVFHFEAGDIQHYDGDAQQKKDGVEFDITAEDMTLTGMNLSAVKLTTKKIDEELDGEDLPQIEALTNDDMPDGCEGFTVSGYPEMCVIGEGDDAKLEENKQVMYSITGACPNKETYIICTEMLTSDGQNGGGLTLTDPDTEKEGQLVGIYQSVTEHNKHGTVGTFVRITKGVKDWLMKLNFE